MVIKQKPHSLLSDLVSRRTGFPLVNLSRTPTCQRSSPPLSQKAPVCPSPAKTPSWPWETKCHAEMHKDRQTHTHTHTHRGPSPTAPHLLSHKGGYCMREWLLAPHPPSQAALQPAHDRCVPLQRATPPGLHTHSVSLHGPCFHSHIFLLLRVGQERDLNMKTPPGTGDLNRQEGERWLSTPTPEVWGPLSVPHTAAHAGTPGGSRGQHAGHTGCQHFWE